ncbi:hypothetical protein [Shewanella acanthi]|uniref:hypothetical protein n=1 Tax=Shewanella acanthi TaxID=2864212 RepID=UPI001C65C9C1|nr:hypothetical protein [Shewanella acanthi]QYJ79425.1 hypothetical protein K0H61_02970 [Shewanella acanthi]
MPNFGNRVRDKMVRVFQRLADPCRFTPADGSAPFIRLVNLDDNGAEIAASANEYIPELINRAEFLQSEGSVSADDEFELGELVTNAQGEGEFVPNGKKGRLTQRVSMDSVSVTFIYVPL